MRKSEIESLVAFIGCRGQVRFFARNRHTLPNRFASPIRPVRDRNGQVQLESCSPIHVDIEQLRAPKNDEIVANNADNDFIPVIVVRSVCGAVDLAVIVSKSISRQQTTSQKLVLHS